MIEAALELLPGIIFYVVVVISVIIPLVCYQRMKEQDRIKKQKLLDLERSIELERGMARIRAEIAAERELNRLTQEIKNKKQIHVVFCSDKAIKYDAWI